MLKSYLKIALRGLVKHRVYSLINISGLAVGMAVALLIGLLIHYEFSYNRFLSGYDQSYQIYVNESVEGAIESSNAVPLPVANALRNNIPGIRYVAECDWMQRHGLMVGEQKLYLSGASVGGDFLKIFRFPLLQGHAETALSDPYSIILTARTARALFGDEDPMGKSVRYDNRFDLQVTGVMGNIPSNSSFYFQYLVPFSLYEQSAGWVRASRTQWENYSFQIYAALDPNASREQVSSRIRDLIQDNSEGKVNFEPELGLYPFKDWHLYNEFENGQPSGGYIDYLQMFGLIGLLVLILACINFTNLATARSEKRAKEVGVRKAIGSKRKHLVTQFLVESFLITSLAAVLSLILVYAILPFFNDLANVRIQFPLDQPLFWIVLLVYTTLTALMAGSRPAWYLSSFQAVKVLKGKITTGRGTSRGRKILVLLQFSSSIALIIGTMVIYRQINYVQQRPVGYDQERLMMTRMTDDLNDNYQVLRNEMLQSGVVESVAWGSSPITSIFSRIEVEHWPGKTGDTPAGGIAFIRVTEDYFNTLGIQLLQGRNFHPDWQSDSTSLIINRAAADRFGLEDPVNQTITLQGGDQGTIVGLVEDALMISPYDPVVPTVFAHGQWGASMLYRLRPEVNTQQAIATLSVLFNRHNPTFPYEYEFVDDTYAQKFRLEVLVGKLAAIFAALAIFVSCLGLFGLATYLAEQRRKEIGIRKVLGASLSQIWLLLSREFIGLILLSCIIAVPIALYFIQRWLAQYTYRIDIGPGEFIIAGLGAVLITLITISFQAIRAGRERPVESLRVE
ncbi:ABC transporter permease [Flavilitoribacter nigricans]|uniref:ABC transporter permease n=1 Tax=Flavilitoribacter nigricans (strain ATCC 23147 / DSM 23189 / NBRC 102662 / NCIMB 1420 / SS-2) TaxID=1122177 RepID=A0A2D0NE23_FLAN2|nr:ABC transporter permease [Flavilitoribacter nigricans]PHN06761.1 hypothetical protein CRP01_10745 [Flavilitoribacter nigricans DSM 23189 = NBRC 102662]